MLDIPKTQYANCDGIYIAYQVFGEGEKDLVYVPGTISNIEMAWEDANFVNFFSKLAECFRVIIFDKRGQGVSDPIQGAPNFEERMEDVGAVMESAGSRTATLLGTSEGGPMCILFAATYPEKVDNLVLHSSMAKFCAGEDYPYVPTKEYLVDEFPKKWVTREAIEIYAPNILGDVEAEKAFLRFQRQVCSPNIIRQTYEMTTKMDVRPILPLIDVPTLILHNRKDRAVSYRNGRYLADHIPNATYLEFPGRDHVIVLGETQNVVRAVTQFAETAKTADSAPEKRLSTVLFTDIVGSTEMLSQMGDHRWRKTLDRHDALTSEVVAEFNGRVVKSTGDGILAIFDKPSRAIRCAAGLVGVLGESEIPIRAGLHVGEIRVRGDDVTGMVIHTAARVVDKARAGEVLITRLLADLTADQGFTVEDRGAHSLKGQSEQTELLRIQCL